jgi:UDP-N-acetyl-D-glucosamine dehydrogenase
LTNNIAIVGLGYVGLPLAVAAANSGYKVFGVDINKKIVENINSGFSLIEDVSSREIKRLVNSGFFEASSDFKVISEVEIVLICVPTPITLNKKPDLTYLESAVKSVSLYIKKDTLVILESSVAPGTTRNILVPMIETYSGLNLDSFHVAYSPERIDPKNSSWGVVNTPKLVAGITPKAFDYAANFYSKFINTVIECESTEIAETAKLLENSFRLINISFINEISIFCRILGIDVNKVIEAAATKPYGFMAFHPSIGIGGHCIPVDPMYLADAAKAVGAPTRFIDLADQINREMPGYFVGRAEEKLGGLKNKKILVVGVAYKPNVADVRETPVSALINGLREKGAQVSWHDDLVKERNGEESVTLSSDFDLAIIATSHDYLDLTKLVDVPILNTRESI